MKDVLNKAKWSLIAELLFNILPILIVSIVHFSTCNSVLTIKDFLFVSIILYGQSIVKFASGISNLPKKTIWQYVSVIVTSVITMGLVPNCVLLISYYNNKTNGFTDILSYIVIGVSLITFFFIGLMGQAWLERKEGDQ